MNELTKKEIKTIIIKINEGLTYRTFSEDREIETEYYREGEIYKKGTFHYKAISPPQIFKNIEELQKDLKNVLICDELKEALKWD